VLQPKEWENETATLQRDEMCSLLRMWQGGGSKAVEMQRLVLFEAGWQSETEHVQQGQMFWLLGLFVRGKEKICDSIKLMISISAPLRKLQVWKALEVHKPWE
jgi:hypothetical protein